MRTIPPRSPPCKRSSDEYPGIDGRVETYLSKKLREALTGEEDALTVRVYGQELPILYAKAEEIRDLLAKIKGCHEPQDRA